MKNDPIVEEVRNARAKLFAECGDDLNKLIERLKASEEQDRPRLVTLEMLRTKKQAKDHKRPT